MTEITSVTIHGIPELERKLGRLAAVKTLRPPMEKSVRIVEAEARIYPPPPPASSYVRTGKLGRQWLGRVQNRQASIRGIVGNEMPYAHWVHSPTKQAWMHKGRWPTTENIVEKTSRQIAGAFEDAIRKVIND